MALKAQHEKDEAQRAKKEEQERTGIREFLSEEPARRWLAEHGHANTHEVVKDGGTFRTRPKTASSDYEQQKPASAQQGKPATAEANPFADYNALAQQYGYEVRPDGAIGSDGKFPGPKMKVKGGRLRIESGSGDLLASYAGTSPDGLGKFLESFWYAEKKALADGAGQAAEPANDRDHFTLERMDDAGIKMSTAGRVDIESRIAVATQKAVAQWQQALRSAAANPQAKEPSMATPAVLRIMGAKAQRLVLARTYLRAIADKHPDVPASVFENLPALLADPLFIIPHKNGGGRVFVQAATAKGEPIFVGVNFDADGRIHTVSPLHEGDGKTGVQWLAQSLEDAMAREKRIYARNNEALERSRASAAAAPATIALHRGAEPRVTRSRASIVTRAQVVKKIAEGGPLSYSFAGQQAATAAPTTANNTQPTQTGATVSTIAAAIRKAYGNVLDKLQAKGLVTLAQSQDEAIEAAAKARAKATGKPLAEVREQLLESVRNSIAAWHGTPHRGIEQTGFTLNKIGTGEGAQAYGWGMYFASMRAVADGYRKRLSGVDGAENLYQKVLGDMGGDTKRAKLALQQMEEMTLEQVQRFMGLRYPDGKTMIAERDQALAIANGTQSRGQLYSLDIPIEESDLLDWDKPLSEQSPKVREALERHRLEFEMERGTPASKHPDLKIYGSSVYGYIEERTGSPQAASEYLQSLGIPGLRYLDGNSRNSGDGSANYVIWDEALMTPEAANIEAKFSQDGAIQGFYDPQSGQSFLIADGMTNDAAPGVLAHEVGIHMATETQDARGKQAMDKLVNRAGLLLKADKSDFMKGVRQRMRDAGETSNEEAAAYIAEAYERDRANAPASVKRWVQDFMAAVRAWLFQHGVIVRDDMLTPADIAAIARANVRAAAKGSVSNGGLDGQLRRSDASPAENEVRALVQQYASTDGAPTEAEIREAVRQFRETERAYGGRDAYQKAKDAGRTKLTYGQWVQVRTENFKRFFGDWQAARAWDAIQGMEAIEVQGLSAQLSDKPLREEAAIVYERAAAQGAVTTTDGRSVTLTSVGFKKTRFHSADRRVLDLLGSIREVLGGAQLVASVAHEQSNPGDSIRAWHYYGAKVNLGGQELFAKLVVRESVNGQIYYDNDLSSIEKISGRAVDATQNKPGAAAVSADKHTLADLLYGGNPEAVSKVVDPETGEPLVVYHGTPRGEFTVFDDGMLADTVAHPASKTGFFFITDKLAAQAYSLKTRHWSESPNPHLFETFLNIREPNQVGSFDNIALLDERLGTNMSPLDRQGDGVSAVVSGEQVWVAYRSNQIKSATGNIGTFGESDDIRFSRSAKQSDQRRPGTAQDKAVMQAIADGKSARDVLRLIASQSRQPFNRQVARLLLKAGITPNIQFGYIGKTKKGDPIHGQYRGKSDTILMAGSSEYAAERIFMHEAMHAATMRALAKPGLTRLQMQKLLEHVRKQPGAAGFYGLKNVDEFVAEVFTNPDFQAALRKMNAPSGSSGIKTAWDGFVRILRSILGLKNDPNNALSQALELGVAAVREDMGLRKRADRASLRLRGDVVAAAGVTPLQLRVQTVEWAKQRWSEGGGGQAEVVRNTDPRFGKDVRIAWQGVKHAIAGANQPELRLIPHVAKIMQSAQYLRSEDDRANRAHIKKAHFFEANVVLDGERLLVGMVVHEKADGQMFYDQFIVSKARDQKDAPPHGTSGNGMPGISDRSVLQPSSGGGSIVGQGMDSGQDGVANFGVDDFARNVGEGIKSITATNIKKVGNHKLTDWLKLGLQFLGRRQIVDIYGDMLPLADQLMRATAGYRDVRTKIGWSAPCRKPSFEQCFAYRVG